MRRHADIRPVAAGRDEIDYDCFYSQEHHQGTSALSKPNFWVERLQLATGIADFHLPVDAALRIVDVG